MYKYNKELLKLLLLIILILIIPLIFISLEAIQRLNIVSTINPNEVITNTLDEFYQNIESAPKNNDPSTIRKCLLEIFQLMNEKNYDKLYDLLTDNIKEYVFPSLEDFSLHMDNYLNNSKYSPKFSEYEKLNKEENTVFIVKVDYLPYSTDEIITNNEAKMSDTFTLYMEDDKNYKFSFLSYIGTGKSDENIFQKDNISFKLETTHLYTNQTIFEILVENNSDSDMIIDEDGIFVYTGIMPKYYTNPTLIPRNSEKTIQFTIYTGLNLKDSLPTKLYFKGVHANNQVYLFTLPIRYPIKISSLHK